MVYRATQFTPQVLLSAPRRSAGVPNAIATLVLYSTSTYSFETHKKTSEVRVLDVRTGSSHLLAKDQEISDLNWLDDDQFVCLRVGKDGSTALAVASVSAIVESGEIDFDATSDSKAFHIAGSIDASAANLKIKALGEDSYAVVVSALASPDGSLYNAEKAKNTHSSGLLYTKLFVRHWDRYESKQRDALWYAKLSRGKTGKFSTSAFTNAIPRLGLECPISTFGGTDNFDISTSAIIFVAKDPEANPALNTKCNTYLVRVADWAGREPAEPRQFPRAGFEGAATSPVFSPNGKKAAWLKMKTNGYEADRNYVFVLSLADVHGQSTEASHMFEATGVSWNRSASSVQFSADNESLLITAEDEGTTKLYMISGDPSSQPAPRPLTQSASISDVRPLPDGRVFISGSSAIDNSFYQIVQTTGAASVRPVWTSSSSGGGSKFGLKPEQLDSIWTPASNPAVNEKVHSLVVRPSSFEKGKRYPVAYLIHGGPQGAWADSWSTRWNMAVFAEQGYIVVAPNPTGSTGYGPAFTDAIRRNWGGDPYVDIVNVFDWVGSNMPEADNDRAVALGASYGGYMMNWIQGHDLGRKFKALVCHDGITSFASGMLPTEELYFPLYDLGGVPWYDPGFKPAPGDSSAAAQAQRNFGISSTSAWKKWDPSEHFANWATPQLVIHGEKDYRLTTAEGLAAFNVLQARGVESQLLIFPDENHWVLKPENSLVWHKTVINWINKYVGLPPLTEEDITSDEFFGGLKTNADATPAEMPTIGKVET